MTLSTGTLSLSILALLLVPACRIRTSPAAPKHVYGRTSVPPAVKRQPCKDGVENPEAVIYVKELSKWIMLRNPETFTGDYAPETFCFAVSEASGLNANADPATGLVTVRADMIRMSPNTDDALAAVISHELAHVTMQHRLREPVSADLPKDIDLVELARRQTAQKAWQVKIKESRTAIIDDAIRSGFMENVSVLFTDHAIWERIVPLLGQIDKGSYQESAKAFMKMDEKYASAIKNPQSEPVNTWRLLDEIILNFEQLVASIPDFKTFSKPDPANCHPENICQDRKIFESIFNYVEKKLRPSMDNTCGLHLDAKDDPNQYPPWLQWMEQQADEVGFEFYLRAGLSARHFTTFIETMMEADKKFDLCLQNMKKKAWKAPRITDEYVDGHPPYCFRYDNLTVQEMISHEKEYSPLVSKAILRTLPELLEFRNAAISALTPKT